MPKQKPNPSAPTHTGNAGPSLLKEICWVVAAAAMTPVAIAYVFALALGFITIIALPDGTLSLPSPYTAARPAAVVCYVVAAFGALITGCCCGAVLLAQAIPPASQPQEPDS